MIVVMKPNASDQSIGAVTRYIEENGLHVHISKGDQVTIIGVVGDKPGFPPITSPFSMA